MAARLVPYLCGETVRLADGQLGRVLSVHPIASGWELVLRSFNDAEQTSQTLNVRIAASPTNGALTPHHSPKPTNGTERRNT